MICCSVTMTQTETIIHSHIYSCIPGEWQAAVFQHHVPVEAMSFGVALHYSNRTVTFDCHTTATIDCYFSASCTHIISTNTQDQAYHDKV